MEGAVSPQRQRAEPTEPKRAWLSSRRFDRWRAAVKADPLAYSVVKDGRTRHLWLKNSYLVTTYRKHHGPLMAKTACGLFFERRTHILIFAQVFRSVNCPDCLREVLR